MVYIIRTNKYIGAFYHDAKRGIVRRIYQKGRWQAEQTIAGSCRDNFTVHYENEIIYMFCQDSNGDILAITVSDSDGTVNRRVAVSSQSKDISRVFVHPVITGKGLMIIFNAAGPEDRGNYLMAQRLDERGNWAPAAHIDKYWSGSFEVQRLTNDHLLLFYQTGHIAHNLGYREITPEQQGAYNVYYTTKYNVQDISCLTTDNGVHTLFVVKGMFSSQLFYRRNITGSFDAAIMLYEAQRIENCLLFCVNDKLFITFLSSGSLLMCVSDDKGASFSRPARYLNKFCQNPVKAYYVSQDVQSESGLFLRQVYVDSSSPWDIQIIPELFEGFFPAYTEPENNPVSDDANASYEEEILRLKNQVELLRRHSAEKDAQLAALSRLLAERVGPKRADQDRAGI